MGTFCILFFVILSTKTFGRLHTLIAHISNILSVFVPRGKCYMRYAMHYFWKCLGPQFLICFYYPVNIYNVGGLPYPAIIELRRQIKKSSILLFNIWKLNTWTLATICLWLQTQFLNLFYLVACNCLQPIKCYVRGNFENPHCVEVCVK